MHGDVHGPGLMEDRPVRACASCPRRTRCSARTRIHRPSGGQSSGGLRAVRDSLGVQSRARTTVCLSVSAGTAEAARATYSAARVPNGSPSNTRTSAPAVSTSDERRQDSAQTRSSRRKGVTLTYSISSSSRTVLERERRRAFLTGRPPTAAPVVYLRSSSLRSRGIAERTRRGQTRC